MINHLGWFTLDGLDSTIAIQACIDRLKAGDDSAREALLRCARDRLALLAHKMLRGFPAVRRWDETDDVLQNSMIRLDRALLAVAPATIQDFFRLAATQIRRELIDLARRYSGPEGLGANCESWGQGDLDGESNGPAAKAADLSGEPSRIAIWTEFHQRVGELGEEDREVFDLLWYQGLTQSQAAAVLDVTERTVSRRWIAARLRINALMKGQLPE